MLSTKPTLSTRPDLSGAALPEEEAVQMPRPSEEDKERFRSAMPHQPDVVVKPMFGNLGAFVNGNMFAGLFGPTIGVRLSDADRAELESSERTVPFGPEDRPMGGYVGLPEVWNEEGDGDQARARAWVTKAYNYVAGLPPKEAKEPKVSKTSKAPTVRKKDE